MCRITTSIAIAFVAALSPSACSGFAPMPASPAVSAATSSQLNAYVPDGLSPEQYRKIQAADRQKMGAGKNLGRVGPRGFKRRSMQAWQEAYEKGEAGHSIAPFGYRELLKQGKIQQKDVPYMVRGGSWDNSDVKGGNRLKWNKTDRAYANGGYKKEQSVSILGSGPGFNWTGEKRDSSKNSKWLVPGLS